MIDWIGIDTDYNGEVFRVAPVDLPEWRDDLVAARYVLPAEKKASPWRSRSSTCWAKRS